MSNDTKSSPNIFKEGKYQKEYQNEEIEQEQDFETELANKWLKERFDPTDQRSAEVTDSVWPTHLEDKQNEKQNEIDLDAIEKAAKASHYKDVAFGYQFIQLAAELTRDMEPSQAAIMSHVYKYLFRLGRKDDPVQEAEKAIMYLKIFIKYYKGTGGGHFEMPEELL